MEEILEKACKWDVYSQDVLYHFILWWRFLRNLDNEIVNIWGLVNFVGFFVEGCLCGLRSCVASIWHLLAVSDTQWRLYKAIFYERKVDVDDLNHYLQNNQLVLVQGSEQGFHTNIEFWMACIVLRSVIEGGPWTHTLWWMFFHEKMRSKCSLPHDKNAWIFFWSEVFIVIEPYQELPIVAQTP